MLGSHSWRRRVRRRSTWERWRGKTELEELVQPRNRPLRSEKRREREKKSRRYRASATTRTDTRRRRKQRERERETERERERQTESERKKKGGRGERSRRDWGICKRRESRTKPCRNHLSCRGGFHKLECDAAPPDRHTPV